MLSRVADSIFWMSCYIERAENVARFIDVNWNLLLDSDGGGDDSQWQSLIVATGDHEAFAKSYGAVTRDNVIRFLSFDSKNPNSILSCVRFARENARTIRDVIASDMWEQINMFYLMVRDAASADLLDSPYEFFKQVRMNSNLFLGVTDTTMRHGEGWNFCRLGQMLERCDKTSRILDVKYNMLNSRNATDTDNIQWAAVLRSASALEMYRKHHRRIVPERVVEFMMFDADFPRAVLFCVAAADEALHNITGTARGEASCDAERMLCDLHKEISTSTVHDVLESGLHHYVDALQTKLNAIGFAAHESFFSMDAHTPKKPEPAAAPAPAQTQSQSQTQTQR